MCPLLLSLISSHLCDWSFLHPLGVLDYSLWQTQSSHFPWQHFLDSIAPKLRLTLKFLRQRSSTRHEVICLKSTNKNLKRHSSPMWAEWEMFSGWLEGKTKMPHTQMYTQSYHRLVSFLVGSRRGHMSSLLNCLSWILKAEQAYGINEGLIWKWVPCRLGAFIIKYLKISGLRAQNFTKTFPAF